MVFRKLLSLDTLILVTDWNLKRFAMGTLGWGPGIALYAVFGVMAAL